MASYTTPRTASIGDTWTAAWYNAEVRDNIKWLHDLELSSGATFPASPLAGQRHTFVSGQTRLPFTYDGSNWISAEFARAAIFMNPQVLSGSAMLGTDLYRSLNSALSSSVPFPLRPYTLEPPSFDVTDCVKNGGMTLQGRLEGLVDRSGTVFGSGVGILTVATATASVLGATPGADSEVAASATTFTSGFYSGTWADLVSGSVAGVQLVLSAKAQSGSGGTAFTFLAQAIRLRYKL